MAEMKRVAADWRAATASFRDKYLKQSEQETCQQHAALASVGIAVRQQGNKSATRRSECCSLCLPRLPLAPPSWVRVRFNHAALSQFFGIFKHHRVGGVGGRKP